MQQKWLMSTHSCSVRVTNFSTHSKFQPVSNFIELHALTLAALCALETDGFDIVTIHTDEYSVFNIVTG